MIEWPGLTSSEIELWRVKSHPFPSRVADCGDWNGAYARDFRLSGPALGKLWFFGSGLAIALVGPVNVLYRAYNTTRLIFGPEPCLSVLSV